MKALRLPTILVAALLFPQVALAVPIHFKFSGNVNNDPFGVFGNASFTGSYTFDSNTPQVLSTPTSGGYAGTGGIFSMSVSFTGTLDPTVAGPYRADTLNITVNNNFPGPLDQYLVTGSSSVDPDLSIQITLSDPSGTAFSNTLLPLTPPNLSAFVQPPFSFALFDAVAGNQIEAEGTLTTLTVPEPATLMLVITPLASLGWFGRLRRQEHRR